MLTCGSQRAGRIRAEGVIRRYTARWRVTASPPTRPTSYRLQTNPGYASQANLSYELRVTKASNDNALGFRMDAHLSITVALWCQVVHASVESVDPGAPTEADCADTDSADFWTLIAPVA